jgi:acyl-CoA thioesterase FadM
MDWERDFYTKGNLVNGIRQVVLPGYVGTTSYSTLNSMYHQLSGRLLAASVSQLVLVSRETRKPVALPEWWRELYKGMMPEVGSLSVKILDMPENTINYPLKVAWSDADGYRHTNMAVYIRFCMDAGAMASLNGKYNNFSGDLANIPMKRIISVYKGESTPGEELTIKTWEQEGRDDTIHFHIFRVDKLLFQSTAVYFRDMPSIKESINDGKEHEPKVNPIYAEEQLQTKY